MANYERAALCCIMLFVALAVTLNAFEIGIVARLMQQASERYKGAVFDCHFYPLVPRLILIAFVGLCSLVCFLATLILFCFEDTGAQCVEKLFLVSLYILFGPAMLIVCFLLLWNFESFGFTCVRNGTTRVYSGKVKFLLIIMCCIAILVTVLCSVKLILQKLTGALRNNDNCFTRFVNTLLCASGERVLVRNPEEHHRDREEALPLRAQEQPQRAQL